MAVASVHIMEFNGGTQTNNPPTQTSDNDQDDVSQLNLTSENASESSSSQNPVTAGTRSFSKWVVYELHTLNDSNKIDNFQVWMTDAPITDGIAYKTNLNTDLTLTTSIYPAPPTATDFKTSGQGDVEIESDFPTSDPGAENIGVSEGSGGLNSDTPFAAGNTSDLIAIQLVTTGATPPGNLPQKTFHFQYDEQ